MTTYFFNLFCAEKKLQSLSFLNQSAEDRERGRPLKKEIVVLLCFLSLFFVFSSETEAAVTNGEVQFYYESSTSETSTSESNTSTSLSDSPNDHNRKSRSKVGETDQTKLLQTNDQRNIVLIIIGILLVAIALLGWRLVKNRRKL